MGCTFTHLYLLLWNFTVITLCTLKGLVSSICKLGMLCALGEMKVFYLYRLEFVNRYERLFVKDLQKKLDVKVMTGTYKTNLTCTWMYTQQMHKIFVHLVCVSPSACNVGFIC